MNEQLTTLVTKIQNRRTAEVRQAALPVEGYFETTINGVPKRFWVTRYNVPKGDGPGRRPLHTDGEEVFNRNSPTVSLLLEHSGESAFTGDVRVLHGKGYVNHPCDVTVSLHSTYELDQNQPRQLEARWYGPTYQTLEERLPQLEEYLRLVEELRVQREREASLRRQAKTQRRPEPAEKQPESPELPSSSVSEVEEAAALAAVQAEAERAEQALRDWQQQQTLFTQTASHLRARLHGDPVQERVQHINLLRQPLIIDGGPGTGKTTTLILRLQRLLDVENLQYDPQLEVNLTTDDFRLLDRSANPPPFVFFAPNDTLADYLREAMVKENLAATSATVRTWDNYRAPLLRAFGLIGAAADNTPFVYAASAKPLYRFTGRLLNDLFDAFEFELTLNLEERINRALQQVDEANLTWPAGSFGWTLEKDLRDASAFDDIPSLFRRLTNLEAKSGEKVRQMDNRLRKAISEAANTLQAQLITRPEVQTATLAAIATDIVAKSTSALGEDAEDADVLDPTLTPEGQLKELGPERARLRRSLEELLRASLLVTGLPGRSLSARQKRLQAALGDLLPPVMTRLEVMPDLRNELVLSRLFGAFLYGPGEVLFSTVPAVFKRYRQENLYDEAARGSALRDAVDEVELQKLRSRPDASKALHPDEAELLLALMFRLVQALYRAAPSQYANSTHSYIQAYRQHTRPLVAVDEASDYSPLQLACITLLAHPRFSCVTLVGDLMQRLGARGLGSWDEYTALFTETAVCSFEVSYRQPKPLLEIASRLYAAQHGVTRPYRLSEHAQSVLNLQAVTHAPGLDAEGRLDWLVTRLHDANSLLPEANLAVLVRNQEAADSLKLAINEHPDFQARGGTARVCSAGSVGQANTLRIFPLDLIKGLEFDGVFIWEADQLDQGDADQLDLQRLVYVAISRASIFLGLSYVAQFPTTLTSVQELFAETDWQSQVRNSKLV